MNLTTDRWVPIVWRGGRAGTVDLREVFERGHEIEDLAVAPHERIALMRLLLCIAQAGLDGPGDYDDWLSCRQHISSAALTYLEQWKHCFELFGDGQRFLQVGPLKKPAGEADGEDDHSTSKLDLALASGNNSTLFDNGGGSKRAFAPGELALMLLTFQCFSPCGMIGVALWNGAPTLGWDSYPKVTAGKSDHAPCLAGGMLHAIVRGDSLLDTLHRNLMSKQQVVQFFGEDKWGRPAWENLPTGPTDVCAVSNATHTYLGRLVPLSRAVWLSQDCRSLTRANGLEYPAYSESGWREPMATTVIRPIKGQPTRVILTASLDKAVWRELHALTVKDVSRNTNGGPAALQNVSDETSFDLWVGGLVASQGKPVDTTESVLHNIPATMLTEPGQKAYEKGVKLAERLAFRLMRAASVYHKELGDNLDRPEMKTRRQQIQNNAAAHFWTDVELAVPFLLDVCASPELLGLQGEWHTTRWGRCLWRAARAAYEEACPHGTARKMRAYALGLKALFAVPVRTSETDNEKESEA